MGNEAMDGGFLVLVRRRRATAWADSMLMRMFQLSSVVDQMDDQEVEALSAVRCARPSSASVSGTTSFRRREEESTADQIQGIKVKLALTPFGCAAPLMVSGWSEL